jgi:FkbM family methyltransferase
VNPRLVALALKQTWLSRPYWRDPMAALRFFLEAQRNPDDNRHLTRFSLMARPFDIRSVDRFAFEEVVLAQEYQVVKVCFRTGAPKVVVDLGANVGLFSLYTLSLWPSAKVHSVEAGLGAYRMLTHNRALNPGLDWHTYHCAVWGQDGQVYFVEGEASTSGRIVTGQTGERVAAITLDTFNSRYITHRSLSLLKMDIEGAEEAVLGSSKTLGRVENLIVEIHPERCDHDRVVAILRSSFEELYGVSGRASHKPMLLACRDAQPLPPYEVGEWG